MGKSAYLLPEGLVREAVGEKLADVGVIMTVGVYNDGSPVEPGVISLILGKLFLSSRRVSVNLFPDGGVGVGDLVGRGPYNGPIPSVQVQEIFGGCAVQIGEAAPPGNCGFDPGARILSEWMQGDIIGK